MSLKRIEDLSERVMQLTGAVGAEAELTKKVAENTLDSNITSCTQLEEPIYQLKTFRRSLLSTVRMGSNSNN